MLFTTRHDDFESEKERNLYYKFFAGYFFNELIPNYEDRLKAFCSLLNTCTRRGKAASDKLVELTPSDTHISFDNHGYLFFGLGTDRGEFADILIHDRATNVLIPIEAKVHSNWSYEKDIISNERRLSLIESKMEGITVIPCLLVTKGKWETCVLQSSKEYSNFKRFSEAQDCRTRVIFWEELMEITSDVHVRSYVENQLTRPYEGFGYGFENNWFVRKSRNIGKTVQTAEVEGSKHYNQQSQPLVLSKSEANSFEELFHNIRSCKLAEKCQDRNVRQYYFENENTAREHQVMFVCESPSTRGGFKNGSIREECWILTKEDKHFRKCLRRVGLQGAYITNIVKCGTKAKCKPKKADVEMCMPHLLSEIALVKPKVIVCVGRNSEYWCRKYLTAGIPIHYVSHYSWMRRPNYDPVLEKELYDSIHEYL